MQKTDSPFLENELNVLKGSYTRIAKKRDCDSSYVSRIASGERCAKSEKASLIMQDLKEVLNVLKP